MSLCWQTRHGDPCNTDYLPVDGPAQPRVSWRALPGVPAATFAAVDRHGCIYLSTLNGPDGANLHSLDPDGDLRWSARARPSLTSLGITPEGDSFLADGEALHKRSRDGELAWSRPLKREVSAVMFMPDGAVLAPTIDGHMELYDPKDGTRLAAARLPVTDMLEGVGHDDMPMTSARRRAFLAGFKAINISRDYAQRAAQRFLGIGVAAKNVPAICPDGRVLTVVATTPGGAAGSSSTMLGLDLRGEQFDVAFATEVGPGCDTSPTLSAHGARAYCVDRSGTLFALETRNGQVCWQLALGRASSASPNAAPGGLIYVSIKTEILCVRDRGDRGEIEWRSDLTTEAERRGSTAVLVNSVLVLSARRLYGVCAYGAPGPHGFAPKQHALLVFDRHSGQLEHHSALTHESLCTPSITGSGTLLVPAKPFYSGVYVGAGERLDFCALTALADV